MELYEAIKIAIEQNGSDIIKEDRFANLLLDMNAYERLPSARFILKILISYNFISNVIYLSNASEKKSFVHTASENLGFKEDALLYVVECLQFGLGLTAKEPTLKVRKKRTSKETTEKTEIKTASKGESSSTNPVPKKSTTPTPKKRAAPKNTAPKGNASPSVAQEIISAMIRAFLKKL